MSLVHEEVLLLLNIDLIWENISRSPSFSISLIEKYNKIDFRAQGTIPWSGYGLRAPSQDMGFSFLNDFWPIEPKAWFQGMD